MAIPPLSSRPPAAVVLDYFAALADSVSLPVVVQDASGYVGQSIPLCVCLDLLKRYGNNEILFKPEASPIGTNLSALRTRRVGRRGFSMVRAGICLVDCFRRGIIGTMPGMEFLHGIVALWRAL